MIDFACAHQAAGRLPGARAARGSDHRRRPRRGRATRAGRRRRSGSCRPRASACQPVHRRRRRRRSTPRPSVGAPVIELHTGRYAERRGDAAELARELERIQAGVRVGRRARPARQRRPRPALHQRAADRRDPRHRRTEHRPRDRRAARVRRLGERGARDEGHHGRRRAWA